MATLEYWTEGQVIANRFRLECLLGEGGMGIVYRATDLERAQECALKFLTNQRGDLDITRFKREFRSAARLNHPNCVRAYELGQDGDHWFFTMEYVAGGCLPREKCHDSDTAVDMGLQILAALDHIHARQIVHRDIKPSNILVTRNAAGDPVYKLSDLGIAKQAGRDDSLAVGQLIGSLRYISPEQARGEPVDPRSDLYSLGMVLYEFLAGQPPFAPEPNAPGSTWLIMHRDIPPTPLCDVAFNVSPRLEQVVMRLLDKDPARRYPMAAVAFDELKACVAGSGFRFGTVPPLERPSYLSAPRFVGRERELKTLSQFVSKNLEGRQGAHRTLFLSGEAGVGKSRVANHLLGLAESTRTRLVVCTCRAEPGAPYEPLGPLMDHLWRQPTAASSGSTSRAALGLTPRAGNDPKTWVTTQGLAPTRSGTQNRTVSNTGTLMEDWAALLPRGTTPAGYDDREGQQWRFHRRVADQLLSVCAQQRSVLLIEDAQWADAPTLSLLGFVVRAVAAAEREGTKVPWAVVVTLRPSPSPAALQEFNRLCLEYGGLDELALTALEPRDAAELVASMLSLPVNDEVERLTRALLARAEGNPLFLGQVLHALVAGKHLQRQGGHWNLGQVNLESVLLPSTIRGAVGDRAARFSVAAQETLAAAAVIGRQFGLGLLQSALRAEQPVVLDSLDELIRAGFIEELGEAWFRFAHDRFREAITDRLSAEESRRLHARVAEELEKQLGTIPGVAADLAHHYAQSQRPLKAYRFSVLAGDEAMQVYAFPKASDLYQAALTLSATRPRRPSKRLLQRHAEASLQAGRFDAAQDSYNRRLGMLDDTLSKAENLRLLADVQYRRGNAEQAGKLLEDVLRLLGFTVPRTRLAYWWGLTRFTVGYFSRLAFPAWALRVEKPDRKAALGIIARVCIQLSEHYYFREYAMAAFYQVAALSVAERVGAGAELAIATAQQGFLIASHGMRGLGLYFLDRGQRFAKQATPMEQAWGELLRGMVHGFLGEVNANIAAQIRSERLLQLCPETLRLRQTLFQRAEAHLMAGQLKQVESLAQQIIGLADDLKDQRSRGWGLMQQGMVAFRQGQFDTAEGLLEKAPACCGLGGDRNNELVALSRWSLVLACQGELDRAATVALNASNNFNRMKLRNPTAACDGAFLVMAGLLLQRDGKWNSERTQAVRRRERTGGVYARCAQYSRPLYETGRAFCDLAQGKVRSGQQHLERAIAFCETLKLYGPLLDVHRLAAVYFKDQPERAAHHRAQAAALLARLLDAPIPQTPVLAT